MRPSRRAARSRETGTKQEMEHPFVSRKICVPIAGHRDHRAGASVVLKCAMTQRPTIGKVFGGHSDLVGITTLREIRKVPATEVFALIHRLGK